MNWLFESLNRRFAAATAAGLIASSLFFLLLFVGLYRGQLERESASTAARVSQLVQHSLAYLVSRRDVEGLRDMVDRMAQAEGIRRVKIADPTGQVRFSSNPTDLGMRLAPLPDDLQLPVTRLLNRGDDPDVLQSIISVSDIAFRQGDGTAELGPEKPVSGTLYVDFDAAQIQHKARATTLLLMGSGALIVLINIAGGWWFIRRYVLRPVERLSAVSRRLSAGELGARIKLEGRDEFSTLAQRFNRMAESLQQKFRELEEKDSYLQALIDAIPDGVRVIDKDYRVVLCNATYRQQHGFKDGQPIPDRCYAASHGRDTPCPGTLMLCTSQEVQATDQPLRVVHRHVTADGEGLDVEVYAAPMRVDGPNGPRRMTVESIRNLQQQVKFSHEQRLSELGRLAAGVAHEIHNPLSSVRLALHAAQAINSGVPANPAKLSQYLDLVDGEISKCEQVTGRLLKLSTPPPSQRELVVLEQAVDETLKLLCWEANEHGIEVDFSVEGGPLRVLATDSDLRMMALNLAQNACHAMPGGGLLSVRCTREGDRVSVAFEDTGVGIEPGDQRRIFEPFFSRRADGVRGTGLGLSITKTIVEGHGGSIRVDSRLGIGSCFTVLFPDADVP
jgi:signal transduction histidine kinase